MFISGLKKKVSLLCLIQRAIWPNGIDMIEDNLYVNYRMNGSIAKFSNGKRTDLVLRTYLNGGPDKCYC
ncbi:MAG: hypothetical protein CM15mP12_1700 [Gammaproteobacteria bacterium]|nr:MAG: hypothetical protein CM15mP12_1700 [Gammaproteobacteria bacterium]